MLPDRVLGFLATLRPPQRATLLYFLEGLATKQIAGKLDLSECTIKIYKKEMATALGVRDGKVMLVTFLKMLVDPAVLDQLSKELKRNNPRVVEEPSLANGVKLWPTLTKQKVSRGTTSSCGG